MSNWETSTLSESLIKCAAKDALISIEVNQQLLKYLDLKTPPLPSDLKGGTAVDIAPYLGRIRISNKACTAARGIVVSDRQEWYLPPHLLVKHVSNVDLQKVKYLIEISEVFDPMLKSKGVRTKDRRNTHATLENLRELPAKALLPIEMLRLSVNDRPNCYHPHPRQS